VIVKRSQDEIQNYLVDASNFHGSCDAVYLPETKAELAEILKQQNDLGSSVTIAGNHTGLTGSGVPLNGVVVSMEKFNRILEINTSGGFALVEPGVVLQDFQNELKTAGYFYPPDPTETNCFVGGTIATNASGAKTFKYGATRNFVLELELILADGESLVLQRGKHLAENDLLTLQTMSGKQLEVRLPKLVMPKTKNASGYYLKEHMDAIDLFIGSEGTLGVITKAKLKILPLPSLLLSCVAFFKSEDDGLNFIDAARSHSKKVGSPLDTRALEYLDYYSLQMLRQDFSQVDVSAQCAVWFEQEMKSENENELTEKWIDMLTEHHADIETAWLGVDEKDRKIIHEFRHAVSSKVNEYISKNNLRKLGTDTAVPDEHFREFYSFAKSIVEKNKLAYAAYGHFGNSHLHLNMLPKNEEEFLVGKEVYKQICHKAVELNGTVSAEHGIGKIKRDYLLMMYGSDVIEHLKYLKKVFDPKMILGNGNMFEE